MDWDEARGTGGKAAVCGEPLHALSVAELEARIVTLEAEIARARTEIEHRRRGVAAADALFKR